LTQILAGGGLAESNYLCECIADLSACALTRSSERELTAKGLGFLIAEQPQAWRPDAQSTRFEPKENPELRKRYLRWQELMS